MNHNVADSVKLSPSHTRNLRYLFGYKPKRATTHLSPAAITVFATSTALQFPSPSLVETEWGEEEQLAAAEAHASEGERRREALARGLRIGQPDGTPTTLATLKAEVAMVVAGGRGAGPAWPTGVGALDEALGGGVPRGRVTEVVGPLGAGKTALVRQLVSRVLTEGGWVAWIDATRTLAPQEVAGLGERLIVVRPRDHTRGAWCADLLLRSGVFALVVLDGAPLLSRTLGVRLSQLARERDAAFVVLREGTQGSRLGGAVRLQLRPLAASHAHAHSHSAVPNAAQNNTRKFSVLVEKGGTYRTVEVACAIVVARRVCTDTEIPDRRGVARRTRAAIGTGSEHAATGVGAHESVRRESTRTERAASIQFPVTPAAEQTSIAGGNATGAAVSHEHASRNQQRNKRDGQSSSEAAWTGRGRGRPRMAESTYGRTTRRGKARTFLRNRDQHNQQNTQHAGSHITPYAEYHGNYQPRKRSNEDEQQSQAQKESRRQSQRELKQYNQQYSQSLG